MNKKAEKWTGVNGGEKQKYQKLVLPAHYFCLFSLSFFFLDFGARKPLQVPVACDEKCRACVRNMQRCSDRGGANYMNEFLACICVERAITTYTFSSLPFLHFRRSKRAAYKYAKDRGAVASRWCWLATQISELDYKIRQHTDLRKHIKDNKGVVALEEVAGFEGRLPGSKTNVYSVDSDSEDQGEGLAARVRPYVKTSFRKRKLVHTANLHQTSKKASRPR